MITFESCLCVATIAKSGTTVVDEVFSRELSDWAAYFALMGGAAATLLGLLFVAVSLRLNIFHQREVADVRRFAAFTLGAFLVALVISGLVLAPHGRREVLAAALLVIGIAGVVTTVSTARLWRRLESTGERALPNELMRGAAYFLMMGTPYIGALVAAFLLWRAHPDALGWLAVLEVWFLAFGTGATWLMLSHAGRAAEVA